MMKIALTLAMLAGVSAECPNACSGHGSCGAYDQCSCYPNWQAADCSEMTCAFGLAHVDTPKGDLDMSASALSSPTTTVLKGSTVYPYGTTEQYPQMTDSSGKGLKNTAHYYMECSNKGICDRKSGECECFDGYAGSFCQRADCPNACSGHGTCETIAELAEDADDNIYALWDKDMTMGCSCDPGYSGADCSSRMCKYGIDPLYIDDESTARVSSATYIVRPGFDGLDGTYAIKFYDVFGEDYQTAPLAASAGCAEVVTALEELPNSVIPANSVRCFDSFDYSGDKVLFGNPTTDMGNQGFVTYDLLFEENPGDLKPMEVNAYLDGARPTVYVANANSTSKQDFDVDIAVYPNYFGISGEFTDYFSDYCDGVVFTVADWAGGATFPTTSDKAYFGELEDLTVAEKKLLKRCLGDADGDSDNNVEVYNWDYGSWNTTYHPHIVKVAPHPTSGVSPKEDVYDAGKFMLNSSASPSITWSTRAWCTLNRS